MSENRKIVLATRSSKLAMAQANIVKTMLEKCGVSVSILEVSTKGDMDRESPLSAIGGDGLFVREIEKKLINGDADIAVHSGKDLPYEIADSLIIAATPKAGSCADCLLTNKGANLPECPTIGTSSIRRVDQCRRHLPDAEFVSIRGNVDTRLKKLRDGMYDGIILAKAGLDRLNIDLDSFDVRVFSPSEFMPAACQGIIAVECRKSDEETIKLLEAVNDSETMKRFFAERYMLRCLNAGCSSAVGVHAELDGSEIEIEALFEGRRIRRRVNFSQLETLKDSMRNA
ncbi:MAG: hydroxymethylbilane synthase [Faecalibacterium sp.]|nr:hydroxymethylbilane synthase [Ruminococcus sp.]MCM1392968.1 hydroxymethylbilane synthase [Ruminococcus sp.]MCM1486578.1 hydroxymethylbilane synthase [Faecalibacterium sp.]